LKLTGEIDWSPLFGGRTNAAWKGACDGEVFVAKLYSGPARNPLFPNDPKAEAQLLKSLSPSMQSPVFRAQMTTDAGTCNFYDHIPGTTWQSGVAEVAQLMAALHAIPCPEGLRHAPDGSQELHDQTRKILSNCAESDLLLAAEPKGSVGKSGEKTLLHSDIVPGNLIRNDTGLHLIDWQCPATGDPCEDIAIFLSPAMQFLYRGDTLSASEMDTFFAAYGAPKVRARYGSLAPFYHWRMAAYCLWQMQNGRPDYAQGLALELEALQRSDTSNPT